MYDQFDQDHPFHTSWQGDKLLFWYAFFMAFPVIVPIFNITIFIFPFLLHLFKKRYGYYFAVPHYARFVIVLFILAVILNVINVFLAGDIEYAYRTLQVAPNYIYWAILLLFLLSHRQNINTNVIAKAVFWGTVSSIIFHFFIVPTRLHTSIPFIRSLTQNSFAFLLICFTPISLYHITNRYQYRLNWIILALFTLAGFLSGSRSGSILTMSSGVIFLSFNRISFGRVLTIIILIVPILFYSIQTTPVKSIIDKLNPRTYELIYQTSETMENDASFLVRMVQIEKTFKIFKKHPITGIGLNNYLYYDNIDLVGMFEGTFYVIKKENILKMSAHNSYLSLLAEGGLVLFIPFILLILMNLWRSIKNIHHLDTFTIAIILGFVAMLIHLWFISAILGVYAWFNIGLTTAILQKNDEESSYQSLVEETEY